MAIVFANLGVSAAPDINISTDLTSYNSASWTPPTSGLIIAYGHGARAAGPDTPTVTGNSLTWTQIGSLVSFGAGRSLLLFAANGAGATTGQTNIDFAGNEQLHCNVSFFHVTGVDLTGGVAAAFVQTVSNSGTATSGSITLSAASHADNRAIACFVHLVNEATTPRTNWTEVDELAAGAAARCMETQWRDDAFETTASASWATSSAWGGIAAELKATVAAGGVPKHAMHYQRLRST